MDLILTGKEGIFVAAKQGDAVTLKQAPDASCSIATAVPKAVGHFIECEKLRRFVHCRFVQVFFCELATGPRARPDRYLLPRRSLLGDYAERRTNAIG